MNISLRLIGDSHLCSKYLPYAKNKAGILASQYNLTSKTYILEDNLNGKQAKVLIYINISLPTVIITIDTKSNGAFNFPIGFSSSGLSIEEINKNNLFYKFYPKYGSSTERFKTYEKLFRNTELISPYSFFKRNNNEIVNKTNYYFGSQYSGSIKEQIQFLLGSSNVDINLRFDYYQTNGLYIDSKGDYWLITIGNTGLYVRKITLINQFDDTVKVNNGIVQQPITYKTISGDGYLSTDIKLLDLSDFYDSIALNEMQGWSFNKKGNKIRNISYRGNVNYRIFEITINENILNNEISLTATQNIVENNVFFETDNYFSLLVPSFADVNKFYPEYIKIDNYNQTKYGPLLKKNCVLPSQSYSGVDVRDLDYKEDKLCLNSFYDSQTDEQLNYYYYYNKTNIEYLDTDFNITSHEDIPDGKLGYFKSTNFFNIDKLNNFNFKHGLKINNDESNLFEDSKRTYYDYELKLENGNGNVNQFAYQVINNLYPVNLTNYIDYYNDVDFQSKTSDINSLINDFISKHNQFTEIFKNNENSISQYQLNNINIQFYEPITYYSLKEQIENINDVLNKNDKANELYRINPINQLNNINKIDKIENNIISFAPYLYEIDNNILPFFQNVNSTYLDDIISKITFINNTIQNSLINNQTFFKNLLQIYINNTLNIKNLKDFYNINKAQVNSIISDYNSTINQVNNVINSINSIINNINNKITELDGFFNYFNLYKNTLKTFLNTQKNQFNGVKLNLKLSIQISGDNLNGVIDEYYEATKSYNGIHKSGRTSDNIKINNLCFIYNYSTLNSLTVYNQENIYSNIFEPISYEKSLFTSNEYAVYKKTKTYSNGNLINETDYILVDTFLNKKVLNINGNNYTFGTLSFNYNYVYYYKQSTSLEYIELYNGGFDNTINKNYIKVYASKLLKDVYINENNITKTSKIKTYYDDKKIEQNSNIIDDYRLFSYKFNQDSAVINNKSINYDNLSFFYYLTRFDDGIRYFNLLKDANTNHYVVSKDIFKSKENKTILTNITNYNIIDTDYVNYIGKPFD